MPPFLTCQCRLFTSRRVQWSQSEQDVVGKLYMLDIESRPPCHTTT